MKSSVAVVATTVGLSVLALIVLYGWQKANNVSAGEPDSRSEFIQSYDPGPVMAKFGKVRQWSGGSGSASGWREATRTRQSDTLVEMSPDQVPALTAALRNDIEKNVGRHANIDGSGSGPWGNSFEYHGGRTWGYTILQPIEPDRSAQYPVATVWHVRMCFIERFRK